MSKISESAMENIFYNSWLCILLIFPNNTAWDYVGESLLLTSVTLLFFNLSIWPNRNIFIIS